MKHDMNLYTKPFLLIAQGTKTVELRLFDKKRRLLSVGDEIIFSNIENSTQKIKTIVTHLAFFKNFIELYQNYDKISLGYGKNDDFNPIDMELYYSNEDIEKYGALAISLEVISLF